MDFYECTCNCHDETGRMNIRYTHITPCCSKCKTCGKNIKIGFEELHVKQCEEEMDNFTLGVEGKPFQSLNTKFCVRCGIPINSNNDSGWEVFVDANLTGSICKSCDEKSECVGKEIVMEAENMCKGCDFMFNNCSEEQKELCRSTNNNSQKKYSR